MLGFAKPTLFSRIAERLARPSTTSAQGTGEVAQLGALRPRRRDGRLGAIEQLILGYYETCIEPDELLVEVRLPASGEQAVYRKFRSRSCEDRPCVAVAAARREGELRVVVGAVAQTPQHYPDVCELGRGTDLDADLAVEIGRRYSDRIEPIDDARGSAAYRRRVIAVEVRRALEELADR